MAVGENDRSLYLGIPREDPGEEPDSRGERRFRIDLCVYRGDDCTVLAESRPFRCPRAVEPGGSPDDLAAVYANPLALLSGAGRFPLVRSVDRLHRRKGT